MDKLRAAPSGTRLPPATAPHPVPPELAGHPKFRIVRELGRGGMGVVYLAEHRVMEKPVALKVMSPAVLGDRDALARFHAEVKAAGRLNHDNIVRAHDAERAGNLHFFVMEFVEGTSLAQLVQRQGPLGVALACRYIHQAALGLQHAFEQGMVHRDIKPQNLMVTPQGRVKVLDFGLARLRDGRVRGQGLTQADAFMGTPEYIAPEQAADPRRADTRADIYNLGCTLYFLLTGRPPFVEHTCGMLVLAHAEKEPAPLHRMRRDMPKALSAVVSRMLAKDPARRFQTPLEVARALAPFAREGPKPHVRPPVPAPPGANSSAAGRTVLPTDTRLVPDQQPRAPKPPVRRPVSAEDAAPDSDWVPTPIPLPTSPEPRPKYSAILALAIAGALALTVILAVVIKVSLDEDAGTPATKPRSATPTQPPLLPRIDADSAQHPISEHGKSERIPDDASHGSQTTPKLDQSDRTDPATGYETTKENAQKGVTRQPPVEPEPVPVKSGKVKTVEADPIKEKLDRARADYKAEMDRLRTVMLKRLEDVRESALNAGKKDDVDRIDKEILAFEKDETPPTMVAPQDYRRARNQARTRMDSAFDTAISDYTKARKLTEATEVQKEKERFDRDLPPDTSPSELLFNGKNLNGWRWQDLPDAKWLVKNGVVVGWNQRRIGDGPRTLETDKPFTNFELYLEAKQSMGQNNSGITFRGLLVIIASAQLAHEPYPTGTLLVPLQGRMLREAPADRSRPERWIKLEIKVVGDRCQVNRDGQMVADCPIDNLGPEVTNAPTRIGLQCRPQSTVQFRNIKIRELPPPGAP
jgi:serine/threonine protein kinase